eukprot:Nitzschia sp. Nitz4//scaffold52_size167869//164010//165267//NITZ4_002300-RA/size167869-snap-gene-0.218-mRNA-1//1//CDS//3329554107//2425//frame0
MWTIPSFEELQATLQDPRSPIGKRMRAAYYCKQLYVNHQNADDTEEESKTTSGPTPREIIDLLCSQVGVKEHGSLLRHEFAYVLGQIQSTDACPTLERVLAEPDDCVMVRHEAAEALGAIGSESSVDVLEQTFHKYTGNLNELADTCRLALHRIQHPLAQVGCACMLAPFQSVDPVEVADSTSDEVTDSSDPEQIPYTKLPTEELGALLANESADLVARYRAMFALRNRKSEEAVQALGAALLKDKGSPLLRHEVAFVLGQLQHPASITDLSECLKRQEEHTMVRHEAAEALGAIEVNTGEEWQRIEQILTDYQQDPDVAVAESCIVALDAADYWGHTVENTSDTAGEEGTIEDQGQSNPTPDVLQFGQQKRMDEQGRKDMLSNHFHIASSSEQ